MLGSRMQHDRAFCMLCEKKTAIILYSLLCLVKHREEVSKKPKLFLKKVTAFG
jgi:hypothetical protein